MITCLVLGGGGFIGSYLTEVLLKKGYHVRVFDNFQTGMDNLSAVRNRIEIVKGDFLNEKDLAVACAGVDYVFHYISTTVPATARLNPIYDISTNLEGTVKLLQAAVNNRVKKIFFPSSGGTIYGEPKRLPVRETEPVKPIDPYGISKLAIERYLHYFYAEYGLDFMVFRYSNPYGERQNPFGKQGVIPIFLNKIKNGEQPVVYNDGTMIRDYIYIQDAIDATMALLEIRTDEKVFNVGSGIGTSINELISTMSAVTGKQVLPEYRTTDTRYVQRIVLDISKIRKETGWQPKINLEEGLQKTWDWLNKTT
jgi:UDP-glucose 4-epimerase